MADGRWHCSKQGTTKCHQFAEPGSRRISRNAHAPRHEHIDGGWSELADIFLRDTTVNLDRRSKSLLVDHLSQRKNLPLRIRHLCLAARAGIAGVGQHQQHRVASLQDKFKRAERRRRF